MHNATTLSSKVNVTPSKTHSRCQSLLPITMHPQPLCGRRILSHRLSELQCNPSRAYCVARKAVISKARMYVPADSFSGQSPERKAAKALRSLFTFVAARVVLEQLQGPAGPSVTGQTSYNQQSYLDLMDFLGVPMKGDGGDEWLASVMRKNHALAMRLMEVREAYLGEFEWQQVMEMADKETREANTRLMRDAAMASLKASMGQGEPEPAGSVDGFGNGGCAASGAGEDAEGGAAPQTPPSSNA